jgi:hypothetical protein
MAMSGCLIRAGSTLTVVAASDETAREAIFFSEVMDPFVRAVLDAGEPWSAYESVVSLRSAMVDYLDWGPHGGAVFAAWSGLEDLYDTGQTPAPDAHAALRQAAIGWLARPFGADMAAYIEEWVAQAGQTSSAIIERDGGFWSSPS